MKFFSTSIVILFWSILKRIHLYRPYIILSTIIKIPLQYGWQTFSRPGSRALVIDHNFIQDIGALQQVSAVSGMKVVRISYEPFYLLAALFFPEEIRDGSYQIGAMHEPRLRYNLLLRKLFALWQVEKWCDVLLVPSDSFFWIRELILIVQEKGIPTIVIDKEGTISPHSMEHHSLQIAERYPFISDYIIVWSERQKIFWQKTGVPDEKIIISGQPRSDFFFDESAWLPRAKFTRDNKRLVLFFTFETDAYAPIPGDHIWSNLREDLHFSLIKLARKYPDICFVVKTHPQQVDKKAVEEEFAGAGVDNIRVLHGPEIARHLIVHADVVIGFQTTALIEAMLAGKRVIYTEWSTEVYANRHHLIPFHEAEGIDIVHSHRDFEALMDSMLRHKSFSVHENSLIARKPFVDIYIPNADGHVSGRILHQVKSIIEDWNRG